MVEELYSDGGIIIRNPSGIGGTWAWRRLRKNENATEIVEQGSGVLLPQDVGMATIESNLSEFVALLKGIQSLPDGWAGTILCDSMNTLERFFGTYSTNGVPASMVQEMRRQVKRLGKIDHVLLSGHPTSAELREGFGRKGRPVSEHNVACDKQCGKRAEGYLKELREKKGLLL